MNYSNFFKLNSGDATRYIILDAIENTKSEKEFYDIIKKKNITFKEVRGRGPGDLAKGTWLTIFFSERFVNLLKENNIKSFKAYPINFKSKYNINMKYYYLEITHKVSEIHLEGKSKTSLYFDKQGNKAVMGQKGLYFNLKEWNGNDIFGIKDTKIIIITKKLKELIEKAKLKNVTFEGVENYEFGTYE